MNAYCIRKNHNAENRRLKARPVGRCPNTRLYVIDFYHAISMLSNQCLDSGIWTTPEFMIINECYLNITVSVGEILDVCHNYYVAGIIR